MAVTGKRRASGRARAAASVTVMVKRVYDPPSRTDGARVLVDRVWPRGLNKEQVHIVAWLRDVGPSDTLRTWFGHDPARWREFRTRYLRELADKKPLLQQLVGLARNGRLTLVYGARDTEHNQAVVIQELLERTPRD